MTNTNATALYAEKADAAFAKYDDACILHGDKSDEAQIALRQYQSAMIEYGNSVALENFDPRLGCNND